MIIEFEYDGRRRATDLNAGRSIAIDLDFDGRQPNHFGVPPANRLPVSMGDFVGRTIRGGSCNVDSVQLIPHCNGTHSESVGHIVDEPVPIAGLATGGLYSSLLISVVPETANSSKESYRPEFAEFDQVITRQGIDEALAKTGCSDPESLIIRTLPNDPEKRRRNYSEHNDTPFLTIEAIQRINELGVVHLIVDLPSIDRNHDQGLLTNHHLFWGVPEGTHRLPSNLENQKTITEMVFVPDGIQDGLYVVNLQIAPFCSDAAPSRPILFPVQDA